MKKMIALTALSLGLAAAAQPSSGVQPLTAELTAQVMALCTVKVSSQVADGSAAANAGMTFGKGVTWVGNNKTITWQYNSIDGLKWENQLMTSHTLRCQRGTNVSMGTGGSRTLTNGNNTLNYTYASSISKAETSDGDIWTPKVSITIPAGQWTAPVGVYSDTLVMDISWN